MQLLAIQFKISHRFYVSSQYVCWNLIFHKWLRFTQTKCGVYIECLNEVFYIGWLLYCWRSCVLVTQNFLFPEFQNVCMIIFWNSSLCPSFVSSSCPSYFRASVATCCWVFEAAWHWCLVMCGCFGNMCTCIYRVLYCLYCVFVLFRLCIFILICFVCTSVRTSATEWPLNYS